MSDLLNAASLIMIPSGYSEDKVYSAVPTDGSGDLSFTRASNGTRVNSAGLVEVCPWNLVEYSEQFDNAYWNKFQATITANSTTAPNGTLTADTITDDTNFGGHLVFKTGIWSTSEQTLSIFAKAGTSSRVCILNNSLGTGVFANLANNTIVVDSGFVGTLTAVGDGWFRITATHTAGSSQTLAVGLFTGTSTSEYTGTGSTAFIWGAQLNIGSTAKPYFPTTDRLNVPRLTYQNGGGGCPSLLLEKQSTNLALYSEEFDNAYWTKTRSTISANNATSPDGYTNADKLVENAISGTHFVDRTITGLTASAVHSFSIFAKKAEREFVNLQCVTSGNSVFVNLNNGVINIAGGYASSDVKVESYSNSWYRITVNDTPPSTSLRYIVVTATDSTTSSYTGDGTSGIYIWGAQLEASSYPTSYIPTTSASATRVADACFKTGISSLIGQTEGTVFVDFVYNGRATVGTNIFNMNRNVTSSVYIVRQDNGTIEAAIAIGGVGVAKVTGGSITIGTRFKLAYAYQSGSSALYINGTQIGTSSTAFTIVTSMSEINLNDVNTYFQIQQAVNFNQSVVFKTRLTNAELASLTTL